VPSVAADYVFPATHSDGDLGPEAVKYGMLFVLRPDFPVPAGASLGERNIIAALKRYGAYVVDQGSSMGLDADSNRADLWSQAGMLGDSGMPIYATDWRMVNVGTPPSPAPGLSSGPASSPKPGGKVRRGRVQRRTVKGWKTIGTAEVRADGTFKLHLPKRKGNRRVRVRVVVPGVRKPKMMTVRL
jgi:hypothetical protein